MKSNKYLEYQFWVHENNQELISNFQVVYETLFGEFSEYWIKDCEDKTIMYFNQNLKNFKRRVEVWDSY